MQTFLSEPTLVECARALDNKRLNKQILEAYQILNVLSNNSPSGAWRNHPAVLMWKGHEYSLRTYANDMMTEAKKRGIKIDKNKENIINLENQFGDTWGTDKPRWFNQTTYKRIMITHRANLYRKDPIYYAHYISAVNDELNKPCCDRCQYFWVTHEEKNDINR